MNNIIFKDDIIAELDQLMDLYNDVEWSTYTDDKVSSSNYSND